MRIAVVELAAAALAPAVILCPGWTFVGRAPRPSTLARAAGDALVVYEVLDAAPVRAAARARGEPPREPELPWRTFVLERDAARELPRQTFADPLELDDPRSDAAARLAAALKEGRRAGPGVVLVCAEVNALRRHVEPGARVRYGWDERVAAAGVPERALAGALVLNPAHLPAGSYVREKRRAGAWGALVSTANALDRARLGRTPLAPPAHAVVGGEDRAPCAEPVPLDDLGSRVVPFEV